jgi:hypothetical protein
MLVVVALACASGPALRAPVSPPTGSSTPPPVASTDTLVVGHATLRGVKLRPGVDTTEVFAVQNGARRLISTLAQTVTLAHDGYLVVLHNESPRGLSLDSVWIDQGTFATLRHVEVTPGGWRRLTFDGRQVTGVVQDSSGEHRVAVELSKPLIDNSIVAVLAEALPLAPGYSATIPSYDISGQERWMTLRVVAEEPIVRGKGTVEALKMTMEFTGAGQWTVIRWLDRSSRREYQWTMKFGDREMIGIAK